jgi:hypothetical protein
MRSIGTLVCVLIVHDDGRRGDLTARSEPRILTAYSALYVHLPAHLPSIALLHHPHQYRLANPTPHTSPSELEAAITTRIASHPRAKLLASLPGVGTINLAQLLAEVGPILDRVDSAEQAAECGAAPVTKASGKTSGVYFRWAANRGARKALTAFAHNSRLALPWAGGLYADARARGKRNPHATRIVARAWLRVIWACWHTGIPYDPHTHLAEQRRAAA